MPQYAFTEDLKSVQKSKPMALIWLAATLGNKSSLKKISKKEISQLRIPQACKQLMDPQKEMALRMSSNLLMGIARVHQFQTNFLYNDINHVLINFKKALREMQQDQALDLQIPEAKTDAITLPQVDLDQILDFEIQDFEFKVPFPLSNNPSEQGSFSLSVAGSSVALSQDKNLMPSVLGPSSSPFAMAAGPPSVSSIEKGGSKPVSSEKSLVFVDPLMQSPAFPHGGDDAMNQFNFDDMGDFNIDFGTDNLERLDVDDLQFQSLGEPAIDLDSGGDMVFQTLSSYHEKADDQDMIFQTLSPLHGNVQEEDKESQHLPSPTKTPPLKGKKVPRKRKFHLLDEKISLTDNELVSMRQDAVLNLQANQMTQWKDNQRKQAAELTKKVPALILERYPVYLRSFMKDLFDESEQRKNAVLVPDVEGEKPFGGAAKRRRSSQDQEDDQQVQVGLDDRGFDQFGMNDYDFDYGPPPQSADISAEVETEIGRAVGSDMPWHAPRSVSASATNSSVPRSTRGRSGTVASTPIRGANVVGADDIILDFQGGFPGSTSDVEQLESVGFDSSLGIGTGEDPYGFDGGEITDLETRSFFEYLLGLARESNTRTLFLGDILQEQPRKTAAAAFYNILRCAHEGYINAVQHLDDVKLQILVTL